MTSLWAASDWNTDLLLSAVIILCEILIQYLKGKSKATYNFGSYNISAIIMTIQQGKGILRQNKNVKMAQGT
jgi:hypothetical protein